MTSLVRRVRDVLRSKRSAGGLPATLTYGAVPAPVRTGFHASAHHGRAVAVAAGSVLGNRRTNEDRYSISANYLVVADGAGGRTGGEVAAAVACSATVSSLEVALHDGRADPSAALLAADEAVRGVQSLPRAHDAVAAVTAMVLHDGLEGPTATLAWLGDTSAWLLRDGLFYRLTHPHHDAQRLADRGVIPAVDADRHPAAKVLLRAAALGAGPPDVRSVPLATDDRLLVATDGLLESLPEERIGLLLDQAGSVEAAVELLLDAAVPAADNVTVAVAFVIDPVDAGRTAGPLSPALTADDAVPMVMTAQGFRLEPGGAAPAPHPGPGRALPLSPRPPAASLPRAAHRESRSPRR